MQNISILVQGVKRCAKKDIYYIQPRTYDFPISKEYLQTILIELYEKGYIRNLIYQKAYSNDVVYFNYEGIEITYDGVVFLSENSTMKKIANTLKEATPIFEIFN